MDGREMYGRVKAVVDGLRERARPYLDRVPANALPLGLLLITTICVFVPFTPAMPAASLDESWGLGINQAIGQGLVFGRDVIFTFGPSPRSSIVSTTPRPTR